MNKILLVQTSFLGDTILSTPVIAAIKKEHPESELWLMTTPLSSELVVRDPLVAGVIPFDKRNRHKGLSGLLSFARQLRGMSFDCVYSLHRSYRTAFLLALARIPKRIGFSKGALSFLYTKKVRRLTSEHEVLRNLSLLEEVSSEADLRLYAPELSAVSDRVRETVDAGENYAVLVPGSAWKTKMWHWEGYRDVARYFLSLGKKVLVLGAPNEIDVAEQVSKDIEVDNLAGATSIAESMLIIKNADVVVCNDSMSLHMASAFKIPTVTVFCATSPTFGFGPWRNKAVVVEKEGLSCKPCRRHGSMVCPTGTEACMRELSSKQVIEAIEGLAG